jgi:biotin transport system ATP-binding protein
MKLVVHQATQPAWWGMRKWRQPRQTHITLLPTINNATLVRGSHTVFKALTLNLVEPRIGLIGDNGAGKSSLFRMLCGLDMPRSGSVQVHGLDAHQVSTKRPGLVGMLFQNPDDQIIFPTVAEELALGLGPSGVKRRDALAQARAFLQRRQLAHWAERSIGSLSQGQRQHVCWLALLIASPELLLLDEPYASLDLPGQARLTRDIAQVDQQVIVSTHALDHVRGFERVIWLDHGAVRADGPGHSVCADYLADVAARAVAPAPADL